MKDVKYIMNNGLAFSESKDLNKLSKYAQKGWLLDGFSAGGFRFRLKKGEPQDIEYSLDYQDNVDEEYFSLFEAAGWTHVLSFDNMHFFSAPTGTKPIYSDQETNIEKYTTMKSSFGKYAAFSMIPVLILFFSLMIVDSSVWSAILLILLVLATIVLVFTGLPYIGYVYRVRKLRK